MKVRDNFRVIIEPAIIGWRGRSVADVRKDAQRTCNQIVEAVRRHLDDVLNVTVESDEVCSFCGLRYEEDDDGPICCNAAVEELEKLRDTEAK